MDDLMLVVPARGTGGFHVPPVQIHSIPIVEWFEERFWVEALEGEFDGHRKIINVTGMLSRSLDEVTYSDLNFGSYQNVHIECTIQRDRIVFAVKNHNDFNVAVCRLSPQGDH